MATARRRRRQYLVLSCETILSTDRIECDLRRLPFTAFIASISLHIIYCYDYYNFFSTNGRLRRQKSFFLGFRKIACLLMFITSYFISLNPMAIARRRLEWEQGHTKWSETNPTPKRKTAQKESRFSVTNGQCGQEGDDGSKERDGRTKMWRNVHVCWSLEFV